MNNLVNGYRQYFVSLSVRVAVVSCRVMTISREGADNNILSVILGQNDTDYFGSYLVIDDPV